MAIDYAGGQACREWPGYTVHEAPSTLRSGHLLPALRRERNPSEAKFPSLSSVGLRPGYFAKGDKDSPFSAWMMERLWKILFDGEHKTKYDENKIGSHPRFFNWGLKRGTDYGADVVIYLDDVSKFDLISVDLEVNKLIDETNPIEFTELVSGKLVTSKVLKTVGQLDETKTQTQAIEDYKQRLKSSGLGINNG